MTDDVLTKKRWMDVLDASSSAMIMPSSGSMWLRYMLVYFTDEISDDTALDDPEMFVQLLDSLCERYDGLEQNRSGRDATYRDFVNGGGDEALAHAYQLARVCREVAGETFGAHVESHVMADYNALMGAAARFIEKVYVPLYDVIFMFEDPTALIRIGSTNVRVNLMMLGRGHVLFDDLLRRVHISLVGDSFDKSGKGYRINRCEAPSLEIALQTIDEAVIDLPPTAKGREGLLQPDKLWVAGVYTHH